MAVDNFLKIEGIEGESTDHKHKGCIEILSFSWGASNQSSFTSGGGGGAGKVNFGDVNFMMNCNKSSPALLKHCATGTHIKSAKLISRKAGTDQQEYYTLTLTDCIVTSYQTSASSEAPSDSFSLAFGKIEFEYKPQDEKGGLGGAIKTGWNIKENKIV